MINLFDDIYPVYYPIIFTVFTFILGAVIGSFLNVVIIRIPRHESITGTHNRSHCMSCGHQLGTLDLVPIFSYIFLGGKCRYCKAHISPRYWIVELVTAVAFTCSMVVLGISFSLLMAFVLIAALVVASGIDIDTMEIPYGCSIIVAALGVIATITSVFTNDMPWYDHLIGAVAIAVPFGILALFGAMGGGDVQIMTGAGLLLGWRNAIPAAAIGIVLGAVGGTVELLTVPRGTNKRVREKLLEVSKEWYDEQKAAGISVTEGKTDAIYGSIFNGKSDIEEECIDKKCWNNTPDIKALNERIDAALPDISKFAVSIIIDEKRIVRVSCKKQIVFGPYLSIGVVTAYLIGGKIIEWYLHLSGLDLIG
ncbi:MAG: prepilin peptidase [Ruminiclostridium sp.]|nr:prepilin peptidase [Ruminiclostridium sp.]